MPNFRYTQADLQNEMNRGIQGRQGLLTSAQDTMNAGVREALTEVRLRSTKRRASLVPNLFSGPMEYAAPSDLHSDDIIDLPPQAVRYDGEFELVPSEQFRRAPRAGDIAMDDANGVRTLLINSVTPDFQSVIDSLSTDDHGGFNIWNAYGTTVNVDTEGDDYVNGSGSVEYDIGAGTGVNAGVYNDSLPTMDLSDFAGHNAAVFVYARVTSITGLTDFRLRLGNDDANFYEYAASTKNDGTEFVPGWNLLRFDLVTPAVSSGTPDMTDVRYVALFITKDVLKVSESGYLFNYLVAKKGQYADISYYSKYPWQSSAGVYKENSTDSTDLLTVDTNEFDLVAKKCISKAVREADLGENAIQRADADYDRAMKNYMMQNPSEDKVVISSYHDY